MEATIPRKPRLRKLLSRQEVLSITPLSYSTIWDLMRRNLFPRSREIGGKVCWYADEIAAYQANLPIVKLKEARPKEVEFLDKKLPAKTKRRARS